MDTGHETKILSAIITLHELALDHSENEIIQEGLEYAVALTDSEIGYLHMVNESQEDIELVAWSVNTYRFCEAHYERHYPITQAGIWADTARQKTPIIHNDYQNLPDRKGYPEGHAHLIRHLGVPVLAGGKVRILAGVGNKKTDYDETDIATLQMILDKVWELIRYRRQVNRMQMHEVQLSEVQQIALISGWSYDPDEDLFHFDEMGSTLLDTGENRLPHNLEDLLNLTQESYHAKIKRTLQDPQNNPEFVLTFKMLHSEKNMVLLLKGRSVRRERGGEIFHGILQDLTERFRQKEMKTRAYTDPLTGLGNRNRLQEFFYRYQNRIRKRENELYALHFIDLDLFKGINDRYGHLFGDKVLKIVAERISQSIRINDLVIRIGGDEFIVIQTSLRHSVDAEPLAKKIIGKLSEKIVIDDISIQIGASIGITTSRTNKLDLEKLLNEADQALYVSKKGGGGCYHFFPTEARR